MLIVTKPIRVVAFSKSHDPLIMWPGNFLFSLIRFVGLERKRICLIDSWKEASNKSLMEDIWLWCDIYQGTLG